MASVSFEKVEKAYGTTKVIHGVGFDIHDPEFMARHEHHQWQLRRAGADTVVETQDGIRWPVLREPAAVDGLDVSYGVRPEHLAVVECGSAGCVPGEVVVVEPTGARRNCWCAAGPRTSPSSVTVARTSAQVIRLRSASRRGQCTCSIRSPVLGSPTRSRYDRTIGGR